MDINETTHLTISVEKLYQMYLIERGSVDDLRAATSRGFDNEREQTSDQITIQTIKFIVYEPNRRLLVEADTKSKSGQNYISKIQFEGIEFHPEDGPGLSTFTGADTQEYTISKLSKLKTDVLVNCTCLDFYYRFAYFNFMNGTLLGQKPPPYAKKPGSKRPPVNVQREPGMCKHLFGVVANMDNQGFFA